MKSWLFRHPRFSLALVGLLAVAAWYLTRPSRSNPGGVVFAARRGPLDITVINGGSVEALEYQEVRSEVRGEPVKILKIVDEGYSVTEEDVRTNKVLVELDSSKMKQNLVNQDITFQTTMAGLTEAQQGFEIQLNQNRVDVRSAEQEAKFAYMDLEKFLGDRITRELIEMLDLREQSDTNALAAAEAGEIRPQTDLPSTNPAPAAAISRPRPNVNFSKYARIDLLGDGVAKQEVRKREDDLLVSVTEVNQAKTKLEGTQRLYAKGFVTKNEFENDQTSSDKARLKRESSETARDLYIKYEFPKQAEELLSKYDKALRALERIRKEAVSKLAQARAKMRSAEQRYRIEKENRDELIVHINNCVITSKKTGLVVYGGQEQRWYGGNEPIRVGSQVFERQAIITIPDTTRMGVKLNVHESHIKKIHKGLKVRITVDAFPDDRLEGEMVKVGILPDSQNRWMNPDMKLYQCTVSIQGTRDWLKPGMSAKTEILIKHLPDVVYVPMQAVVARGGKQVVYLAGGKLREREVKVGEFNDEFIEIKEGLRTGELVLLRAPESERKAGEEKKSSPESGSPKTAPAPPAR